MSVFQWFGERHIARRKLGRDCIRIRDGDECVPPGNPFLDVARVVRHWRYTDSFQQDLRTPSSNDAEENIVRSRSLKGNLKSKPVAIKRKRFRYIANDKKG